MVYFYQLFLNTDDVILKLYTSLCQKAKCTPFGALYTDWEKLPLALQFHGGVTRAVEQSQHFQVGAACFTILQRWLDREG